MVKDTGPRPASGMNGCLLPMTSFCTDGNRIRLAAVLACIAVNLCISPTPVPAQDTPKLIVAREVLLPPKTVIPFPIHIENRTALPANCFIRISKLPPNAKLTAGHRVSDDTWAVPIDRLTKLRIAYPKDVPPQAVIRVQLVSLDRGLLADETVRLIAGLRPLAPPRLATRTLKRASDARRDAADVMAATSGLTVGNEKAANAANRTGRLAALPSTSSRPNTSTTTDPGNRNAATQRMLARGNQFLLQGNVNAARLFYRRAADAGSAAAAMALAATYDPNELQTLGIVGMTGDVGEAKRWYERAIQLGEAKARTRLDRLPAQ